MSSVMTIENLTKEYSQNGITKAVIEHMSLEIAEREFLCVLGPSGCGKTTLLRCIAGFENYSGSVFVDDKKVYSPGTDRIMVFQDFNQLFSWKTVEDNIKYPLKLKGIKDKEELNVITADALKKVRLFDCEKLYPYQLSGGMKQRVAIAKAIALKPKIILMDEPFAALDALTRREIQNELIKIAEEEDCTFIFVTHNIQEALILGKRLLVLAKGGKVILDEENNVEKPVTPTSKGYGEAWQKIKDAIYSE